jgi:HTH-type transcriptional regulator / antitoxin HigA
MKIKAIKSELEYNEVCSRIYELIHSTDNQILSESPEGEELELLSILVENYEAENFAVSPPDPVEAIKFRVEQMELRLTDIALLFGGPTRLSEVIHKKRPLTLKMITLLNAYLDIPLESLIAGNKKYCLDPVKKAEIMKVPGIRDFLYEKKSTLV